MYTFFTHEKYLTGHYKLDLSTKKVQVNRSYNRRFDACLNIFSPKTNYQVPLIFSVSFQIVNHFWGKYPEATLQ